MSAITPQPFTPPLAVVIMAAGEGTRMKSATPKVLHEVGGLSMVGHAVAAARALHPEHIVVMVGAGHEKVTAGLKLLDTPDAQPPLMPVLQEPRNGTGHAVRVGLQALAQKVAHHSSHDFSQDQALQGTVVVTSGDCPLVRAQTLQALVALQQESQAGAAVLTGVVDDPTGYGRVVRAANAPNSGQPGPVQAVVEHKDATPEQHAITEINTGFYAFEAEPLMQALSQLTTDNAQGEEYLVDVLGLLAGAGIPVMAVPVADTSEALGVNDRTQLAQAAALLRDRIVLDHQRAGVTILDPASTWIDQQVCIAADAQILPGCLLQGSTTIDSDAVVGPGSHLRDTQVGAAAQVSHTTAVGALIAAHAIVGPYVSLTGSQPATVRA